MPVSIVVGGQFGSEGKGKVALEIVRRWGPTAVVVRVGGPNSGHTGYSHSGQRYALRQLPAASIDKKVDVVFPAGSYIDIAVLLAEIALLDYPAKRIRISPYAHIITQEHKEWEQEAGLSSAIGSTGSGVGGAVMASVAREASNYPLQSHFANHYSQLEDFISDTSEFLREKIKAGARIVIEGTQGFGLSLLEGGYWPKATSRSTTAAGALAESGLSPIDVDDVSLVLRSFPIRVAGTSGPLPHETTWQEVSCISNRGKDIREYTTVTKRLRRVGYFDPDVVKRALAVNAPTRVVMNHLDYIGKVEDLSNRESRLSRFVSQVELSIERQIDWLGFSPMDIIEANRRPHAVLR